MMVSMVISSSSIPTGRPLPKPKPEESPVEALDTDEEEVLD